MRKCALCEIFSQIKPFSMYAMDEMVANEENGLFVWWNGLKSNHFHCLEWIKMVWNEKMGYLSKKMDSNKTIYYKIVLTG